MTNPGMGWSVLRRLAGKRRHSTLASGNGSDLAFRSRHSRQNSRSILESGKDSVKMAASEAVNGKCRINEFAEEADDQWMLDRLAAGIGLKILFRRVGSLLGRVHEHMIPGLALPRLGLVRLIPFLVGLAL